MHDEQVADVLVDVVEEAFDDVFDGGRLVVGECLVGGELEQVAVLDLGDAAAEDAFGAQLLEHVSERLAVQLALVVVGVGDALVAVEHAVGAVAGEEADEVRFEVEAG